MAAILPIPTTRTSDYLARTRLVQQIQSDQVDLLRLQTQLSTGRRIFKPSEDPGAAFRAITLQRTIERKTQLQTNITNSNAKLTYAEQSISLVSQELTHVRAEVLGVVGTVASDEQRQAVLPVVDESVDALLRFANSQYQDTYIFAGTQALETPFVRVGNYVEYRGNEVDLQANVDIRQLFDTNISGAEVFGGLSEAARGSVDLNLQVSESTYLSQINGGEGIGANGAVQLSIGLNTYTVDLSNTHTLGDVARAIEEVAREAEATVPTGLAATVQVGGNGLVVSPGNGGLAVLEVSGGTTAQELGIRQETQLFPGSTFGEDIDPALRKTTRLDDLLGSKSFGSIDLGPSNAGINIRANSNGTTFDNLAIQINSGAPVGAETIAYNAGLNEITVTIADGTTTAQDVIDLINGDASVPFEAAVDFSAADTTSTAGQGPVAAGTLSNLTSGGADGALNLGDGLRITNGDGEVVIDTSTAETVGDLLNILNRQEYGLSATINATRDGIDVRSRRAGADFTIGENGGTLAEDLGIRTFIGTTRIEDFNRGAGAITEDSSFLTLDHLDALSVETTYQINLSSDAFGDFGAALTETVGGSLDLTGSFEEDAGNNLTITFAEDELVDTHSALLSGNSLTITVGTLGANPDDTIDIDAIFSSITDEDFTNNILYSPGDLAGNYTVTAAHLLGTGGDAGATITFSGGGQPLTVDDVNARINAATAGNVTASIATEGNGFELEFDDSVGQILRARGLVAERLGFFDGDAGEVDALSTDGTLNSADRNTKEVESVFNTLLRLHTALEENDTNAISIEHAKLDDDLNRATFARSELGARVQDLETLKVRLEDEEVQLKDTLSIAIDADIAEVISDFTARQFSLQASLQTTASLLQLSVLNFL